LFFFLFQSTNAPKAKNNEQRKKEKELSELKAIENIKNTLQGDLGEEIFNLWIEFEQKETFEAKVANALDKLEAQIQHNEADINTWIDIEYKMSFMLAKHTEFDSILTLFKNIIEEEAEIKITDAGLNVNDLRPII